MVFINSLICIVRGGSKKWFEWGHINKLLGKWEKGIFEPKISGAKEDFYQLNCIIYDIHYALKFNFIFLWWQLHPCWQISEN